MTATSPASASSLALTDIGQISIRAIELDRAVAFYRDTLGVPFLFQAPPGLAFFQCGSVTLMVSRPEPDFDHPSSIIYFRVTDIEAIYRTLTGRGVQFLGEPHLIYPAPDFDLWMAFFRDSEQNTLALMERKKKG